MTRRRRGVISTLALFGCLTLVVTGLSGCAAVGLSALTIAAGTGAGVGAGHTLDSITYKTFSVPLPGLSRATILTLDRLDMPVMETEHTDEGQKITARAGDRTVEVELDRLTTVATRMRVVVKKNWLIRDRATATEIILQTDRTLTDQPGLATAAEAKPTQAARKCVKGGASC